MGKGRAEEAFAHGVVQTFALQYKYLCICPWCSTKLCAFAHGAVQSFALLPMVQYKALCICHDAVQIFALLPMVQYKALRICPWCSTKLCAVAHKHMPGHVQVSTNKKHLLPFAWILVLLNLLHYLSITTVTSFLFELTFCLSSLCLSSCVKTLTFLESNPLHLCNASDIKLTSLQMCATSTKHLNSSQHD